MADIKFNCPHCKQVIQCDELWGSHTIQCPVCKGEMVVPQAQAAPPPAAPAHSSIATAAEIGNPLVPKPPAESKLSAGRTQVARSSTPTGVPQRSFQKSGRKGPNPIIKYVIIGLSMAVIGGGGYFGWNYYQDYTAKKEEEARKAEAEKKAAEAKAAAEAAEAANPTPKAPKELPIIPPIYTLDPEKARIPEGKVNGSISGTAFVPEIARIDRSGGAYVLTLCQGAVASPDRAIRVFLHFKATEGPTNQEIEASANAKNAVIGQIAKLYKTDPKYAPKRENFSSGYTLKLELGKMANNQIPGKIYLALPGDDQTVVAGLFQASAPDPNAAQNVAAPAQPQVQVADPRGKAAFDRRYGTKGR